jgi:hypothetical protein
MNVTMLRALLADKVKALPTLKEKALKEGAPADDRKALNDFIAEMKTLNEQLDAATAAEDLEAKLSRPSDTPANPDPSGGNTVPAEAKKAEPDQVLSLAGVALLKSKLTGVKPLKILEDEGYGQLAKQLSPTTKGVNTLVSAEGGILVPAAQVGGGLIPFLRSRPSLTRARFGCASPTASSSRVVGLPEPLPVTWRKVRVSRLAHRPGTRSTCRRRSLLGSCL